MAAPSRLPGLGQFGATCGRRPALPEQDGKSVSAACRLGGRHEVRTWTRPIQATDVRGGPVTQHANFATCGGIDLRVECVVMSSTHLLRMLNAS